MADQPSTASVFESIYRKLDAPNPSPIRLAFRQLVDAHAALIAASDVEHSEESERWLRESLPLFEKLKGTFREIGHPSIRIEWMGAVERVRQEIVAYINLIPHQPYLKAKDHAEAAKSMLEKHGTQLNQVAEELDSLCELLPETKAKPKKKRGRPRQYKAAQQANIVEKWREYKNLGGQPAKEAFYEENPDLQLEGETFPEFKTRLNTALRQATPEKSMKRTSE